MNNKMLFAKGIIYSIIQPRSTFLIKLGDDL